MSGSKHVQLNSNQILEVVTRALHEVRERLEHRIDVGEDTFVALHEDFSKLQVQLQETATFLREDANCIRADMRLQDERLKDHTRTELGKLFDLIQEKIAVVVEATGNQLLAYKDDLDDRTKDTVESFEEAADDFAKLKDRVTAEIDRLIAVVEGLSDHMDARGEAQDDLVRRVDDQDGRVLAMDKQLEVFISLLNDTVEKVDGMNPDAWTGPLGKLDLRLSEHQAMVVKDSESARQTLDLLRVHSKETDESIDELKNDVARAEGRHFDAEERLQALDEMVKDLKEDAGELRERRGGDLQNLERISGVMVNLKEVNEEATRQFDDLNERLTRLDELRIQLGNRVAELKSTQAKDGELFQETRLGIAKRFEEAEVRIKTLDALIVEKVEVVEAKIQSSWESTGMNMSILETEFGKSVEELKVAATEAVNRIDALDEEIVGGLESVRSWAAESFATKEEVTEFRSKADESFDTLGKTMVTHHQTIHDRIANVAATVDEHRDEVTRAFKEIEEGVAELVTGSVSRARQWTPGPPYEKSDVVKWRNGTWVASTDTREEPAFGGDWLLLADGIHDVELRQISGETDYHVFIELSSSRTFTLSVKGPEQNYLGTWTAETRYRQGDIVMRDGSSYVALVHDPQGDPTKSKDWKITAMRGARGRRGERGPMPEMSDVLKTYLDYMMKGDGTPIVRFRGRWQYQESYSNGDIAVFSDSLWICMEANGGQMPPAGNGQGTPNNDWAIFFSTPTFRGLTKVEGDPAPTLGGPLNTKGNLIQIRNSGDQHRGMIGEFVSLDGDSVFMAFVGEDGVYDEQDGAMVVKAGRVEAHGASFYLSAFDKPGTGPMQLYISENGLIYGVEPPAPGWEVSDTDTNDYDLGTGASVGPWVEMTGLVVSVPEDTPNGVRVDVFANVDATNKTATRDGTIDIGFGINGAQPDSQSNYSIPAGFDGYVPVSITTTTHGGLTTGDTISVWARRASGTHGQFGVDLIGADGDPHELIVSKP